MNVVLYSTGCPKCKILKQKMDSKEISYTENTSIDEMINLGISVVPVLSVDGKLLDFSEAIKWTEMEK